MGTYSFKSSGRTSEQTLIETINRTVVPIGIMTPLRPGTDSIFAMHTSLPDQVHNNLRDLLVTNWGERLMLYDFGANLRPLTTELVAQDDFDAEAVKRISTAVARWMPYVSLEDFVSEIDRSENNTNVGVIRITITYTVPALQVGRKALQVALYVI